MTLRLNASAVCSHPMTMSSHFSASINNIPSSNRTRTCILRFRPEQLCQNRPTFRYSMSKASSQSDNPKDRIVSVLDTARTLWESSPPSVKSFPWNKALENFVQLILDLALTVMKYLSIPLFAITSLSEMSYCAHERKLFLVPFPFLFGIAVAGVLRDAALESSSSLKNAEVPWHLIAIAVFFALLKLVGPFYPYWGRILVPHFANGALWLTIWSVFMWYSKSRKRTENIEILEGDRRHEGMVKEEETSSSNLLMQ